MKSKLMSTGCSSSLTAHRSRLTAHLPAPPRPVTRASELRRLWWARAWVEQCVAKGKGLDDSLLLLCKLWSLPRIALV